MAPMTLLLDTHTLLWWLFNSKELSPQARLLLANPGNRVLVSSACAWEIATKFRLGKLPHAEPLVRNFGAVLAQARLEELPISAAHAIAGPGGARQKVDATRATGKAMKWKRRLARRAKSPLPEFYP